MNGNIKLQNNKLVVVQDNGQTSPITIQRQTGGGRKTSGAGVASIPVYGQVYSKIVQTVSTNTPIDFTGVNSANGVTLPISTDIQVSKAGSYLIDWVIEITTISIPD